jgi:hypothetical protein
MKSCFFTVLYTFAFYLGIAQPAQNSQDSPDGDPDRMTLVKNSMALDRWHEQSFWATYEGYLSEEEEFTEAHDARLQKLVQLDSNVEGKNAYDRALKVIAGRNDLINLWQRYFASITTTNNGGIALKFLQTESLLAMMEDAAVYEAAADYSYHRPVTIISSGTWRERAEAMSKSMNLSPENEANFMEAFEQYEEERIDVLGEDYSVYDLYIGDPTDFTPAFAKRMGRDFIEVMKRENKLKQKYLEEMARKVNEGVAARFIAMEDYQSILAKMYLWSSADEDLMADGSR